MTFKIIIFYCFEVKATQQYGHKNFPKAEKQHDLRWLLPLNLRREKQSGWQEAFTFLCSRQHKFKHQSCNYRY